MKIKSVTIENVKSFREKESIDFDNKFNILIGPNGGGKSNVLDIITIVLRHFFIKSFNVGEGNDGGGFFKVINSNDPFNPIGKNLEKFIGYENEDLLIEISFKVTQDDIQNIHRILENRGELKKSLNNYRNGANFSHQVDQMFNHVQNTTFIDEGEITYFMKNYSVINPSSNTREYAYLQYLNNIELFLILAEDTEIDLKPVYLYFSPYRAMNTRNLQANLSAQNYYQLYQNYVRSTSRNISSVIELASNYFAGKRRKLEYNSKKVGYDERWQKDDEVRLVTAYLDKLGYKWDIEAIDLNKSIYELVLNNKKRKFLLSQASSGEKEIINFLLGIFAFNIKNGLIIIDEPELHLHPKWQRILMDLFRELSEKTGNQFILSTHSATFVNEYTISNVIRIYKDDTGTSRNRKIKEENLPEMKELLHMVNSHNNEKLFFADKIVLVEGISDRLIFERLINFYQQGTKSQEVIEVLEVHGKYNFKKYKKLIEEIGSRCYIVADFDYILDLAKEENRQEIIKLFETSYSSIDKTIKDRKSLDAKRLSELIQETIERKEITEDLINVWEYIKVRHQKLESSVTQDDINRIKKYVAQKKVENVFILCGGDSLELQEIENFLPEGKRDLQGIIELVKESKFKKWLTGSEQDKKREVLEKIVFDILGLDWGKKTEIKNNILSGGNYGSNS